MSSYHRTCNKYSWLAARILYTPDSPKKEWGHRSRIPSVCSALSFVCWLIRSIGSYLFMSTVTSCFTWNFRFAGRQPQFSRKSSYLAFGFHGSPGTKSFSSSIKLIYLPEYVFYLSQLLIQGGWLCILITKAIYWLLVTESHIFQELRNNVGHYPGFFLFFRQ